MSAFYKMDPAAWDFGTTALSLEEEAAYLRIVNAIHKHDAPVPDNDRVLAGMFRCSTRKARSLLDALVTAGKVRIEDGHIINDRAVSDLVHRGFISSSRAESGAKGGRTKAELAAKSLENNDPPVAIASPRIEENRIEKKEPYGSLPLPEPKAEKTRSSEAMEIYNAAAGECGWPKLMKMTKERETALKVRLTECGGIEGWRSVIDRCRNSEFLRKAEWSFGFDWIVKPKNFTKILEGNYDNRSSGSVRSAGQSGYSDFIAMQAEKDRLARENFENAEREHQERMEKARRLHLAQREAQA